MIAATCFDAAGGTRSIDVETISEIVGRDGTVLWVDVAEPTDDELRCLEEEFSLHPLTMEDVRKHQQRPKLEQYPTHAFVVAYAVNFGEVDVFAGPGWVVSVRGPGEDGPPWEPREVGRRFSRSGPNERSSGYLLYLLLDELVDGYFGLTDALEDRVEDLEERVFAEEETGDERSIQQELYDLRRDLLRFRRKVDPLREVVSTILRRELGWVDDVALVHLQDVYDHVLRATDRIDSQRELLGNVVEAHLAIISNRMNQVMKKMTSWGAILIGSTLVAGIYGMNFEHMPELHWRIGYPMALGFMAAITIGGYFAFRRRDWL